MYRRMLALVMVVGFLGALGASRLGADPATVGAPNDPLFGEGCPSFIFQIQSDFNGHAYAVVNQQMSWEDARVFAATQVFRGVPGHLATITSAGENATVVSVINAFECSQGPHNLLWLGGEQIPHNEPDPAEGWTWITGEPWNYKNWNAPGEPNDAAGDEYYLAIYGSGNPDGPIGTWNDDLSGAGNTGFIIEWTPCPGDLDGDGNVGVKDLLILLGNWGVCVP